MHNAIELGDRHEPFVDDHLIDHLSGDARLTLHAPRREEVVLRGDAPWEGNNTFLYTTVFRDGDRFRMYYLAGHIDLTQHAKGEVGFGGNISKRVCYAESADGLYWTKPALGLYEFQGSRENNIVWEGVGEEQRGVSGFAPFLDTRPDCPADQRYKATGGLAHGYHGDLYAMVSPDGIDWSLREQPILRNGVHGKFDSQNTAFWDETFGLYRIYVRDYRDGCRDVRTATSADFVTWSDPVWLEYPGASAAQLYTNAIQPYPGASHVLIGFPARYIERPWSPTIEALPEAAPRRHVAGMLERVGTALTDGLFMAGRDGKVFRRFDEAFLRPGPQREGNWMYGDNYISRGIVQTPASIEGAPAEWSLFASEGRWRASRLRRLSVRQDGFTSIRGGQRGELVTKPLRFVGDRLTLNVATSAAGGVRVALEDGSGEPITGRTLDDADLTVGDETGRGVTWRGESGIGRWAGEAVRLRIELCDADLHALRFRG